MSRPINLRPHEARRLAETGRVVVIWAVEPQPTLRDGVWSYVVDNKNFQIWDDGHEPRFAPGSPLYEFCPFGPPGTRLWGRETWMKRECREYDPSGAFSVATGEVEIAYKVGPGGMPEERWRSPATMPRWASRFPDIVHAGSRLCRLHGVTVDEMGYAGLTEYVIALDGRAYDNFERAACKATKRRNPAATCVSKAGEFHAMWDRDNPRRPAAGDPWVWVGQIEKQEGQ